MNPDNFNILVFNDIIYSFLISIKICVSQLKVVTEAQREDGNEKYLGNSDYGHYYLHLVTNAID